MAEADSYRQKLEKISNDSYKERSVRVEPIKADLIFEVETFYGNKPEECRRHADELLINFEEDLVNEELIATMQELKNAERAHDAKLLSEFAKKCQVLSLRKAEVAKKRRV